MGDVLVKKATISEGRIDKLEVHMHDLPTRVIDRDTALSWMKDGHSLVPCLDGRRGIALQLVEAGDAHFIRTDNASEATDDLPALPKV